MDKASGLGIGTHKAAQRFELILNRFLGLLENRFKSGFQYLPYVADHPDWKLIHSLLFRNQPVTLNGDCYFPVFVDQDLIGAIQHSDSKLAHEDQVKISELTTLILSETLNSFYKSESLRRFEDNMQTTSAPAGVVKLADFKKQKAQTSLFRVVDPFTPKTHAQARLLNTPTLIECENIDSAFKMALEIHEESQRFAFLSYWDLPQEVRTNAEALADLGPMTLFLSNPHLLDHKEQAALKQQFRVHAEHGLSAEERPLWLSATTISYSVLLKHRDLDQNLLKNLSMSFLRIQKTTENLLGPGLESDLH